MNRKKAFSFVCKKLLKVKKVPSGWEFRKGRDYDWVLTADKESPQPLGVYVKGFDAQVDNSYKNSNIFYYLFLSIISERGFVALEERCLSYFNATLLESFLLFKIQKWWSGNNDILPINFYEKYNFNPTPKEDVYIKNVII